jgi:hypothetical protein
VLGREALPGDDKDKTKIAAISIAQADDRNVVLMSDSRSVSVPLAGDETGQNADPMVTVTAIAVTFRKQPLVIRRRLIL